MGRQCKFCKKSALSNPYLSFHGYTLEEMAKCVSWRECLERNTPRTNKTISSYKKPWFVYNGECRFDCPEGTQFNSTTGSCEPCDNYCVKYCDKAELTTEIVIENMKGCTHITGPLSILNLVTKEERSSLYKNLKSLRYIRDYLLIARNEVLEDLAFLPNLTEIGGVNLYANKSLFVYDNRNLKKLWDVNKNVSLIINNGDIGFHDNEQLCLTDIEKFSEKTGIDYDDTDVSKYSNGVYCEDAKNSRIAVTVTEINTDNATIVWERMNENSELYYTVYYTDSNPTNERQQDVCSPSSWITFSTVNNSAQLVGLKVFKTYYYYIKTYRKDMEATKTPIKSFQTLPDDPQSPADFKAHPIDHNSIRLVWTKPHRTNGNLSMYTINIDRVYDDPDIAKRRDYCVNPFSDAGRRTEMPEDDEEKPMTHEERVELYELGPPEYTYPERPCAPTAEELNIELNNHVWLYLCDKNSQSKYGIDYCKNYYYDLFNNNHSDIEIHKRSGEKTSTRKKSSLAFPRGEYTTEIVDANRTSFRVKDLEQFSLYVFYIFACNEKFKGRRLCSPILQTSARTLRNPNADDISDFSIKIVNQFDIFITWSVPKRPNGFILAYNVYYKRDLVHSKNQTECISHETFLRDRNVTLRNMLPGGYYMGVQAISLAGPGRISKLKYIIIGDPGFNPLWLIFVAILALTVITITIIIFFRIKGKRLIDNIQLITNVNPDYAPVNYEPDEWEMDRGDIELIKTVGQGTFGRVYLGQIKSKNMACAVKTVNEEASLQERIRFLNEASTMKEFTKGNHVVKLYGVVSKGQPPLVIMELMELGDLKKYLLRFGESSQCITSNEIYRMAIEIADGLAFLTSRKHVHRDLAARNCMVSNDKTVKIGDFGMTRDIYQSDYYKKGSGSALLPVRWMAPESIADGVNTYDSDIWSYGIVLWEIVTLAAQPYQGKIALRRAVGWVGCNHIGGQARKIMINLHTGLSNEEVTQFVVSKGTLNRPAECPNLLWEIMEKCWNWYPTRRPTCFEIIETLQDHVGRNFKSLSFYHSTNGQEYMLSQGSVRPNNPSAMAIGGYRYEDNAESEAFPLNIAEEAINFNLCLNSEFISPSSRQQARRFSQQFH